MSSTVPAIGGTMSAWRVRLLGLLRHQAFLPACFGVFVSVRLAVLLLPVAPTSDAAWYVQRGLELAAGQGYHEGASPTAFWPIGFPLFLGAVFFVFGSHLIVVKLANLALSCGIFWLTYRVARHMFRDEYVARLAVLLLTLYPNQIGYTGLMLSEMLATLLLLWACDIFMTGQSLGRTLLAGIFFGYGALVKAQFVCLPGIMVLVHCWGFWTSRRKIRRLMTLASVFAISGAVVVLPVTARNYMVFHQIVLISTNGGPTFLGGNNPYADGANNDRIYNSFHFPVRAQIAADQQTYALALAWIKANPSRFLELIPLKVWHLWAVDGESEWGFESGYRGFTDHAAAFKVLRIINQIFYMGTLAGAFIAITRIFRGGNATQWAWLGVGFFAFITLISVAFSGQSRFHFPAMPFALSYAAWVILRPFAAGGSLGLLRRATPGGPVETGQ